MFSSKTAPAAPHGKPRRELARRAVSANLDALKDRLFDPENHLLRRPPPEGEPRLPRSWAPRKP